MSQEIETLHRPFLAWLRREGVPFINARSDRESTIAVGWPDVSVILSSSVLLIEFKAKEGKLSREQKELHAELEKTGTKVHVLRDLSAAIELVNAWRSTLGAAPVMAPGERLQKVGRALYREENGTLVKVRNLRDDE